MRHDWQMPTDNPNQQDGPEPSPLQRVSAPLLVQLSRVPKWALLIVVLALTIGGLLQENAIGGVMLLVLAAFAAWLAVLGWPRMTPVGRLLRLLVVGLILYAAFSRLI